MKVINYLKLFTTKQLEELARKVVKHPAHYASVSSSIFQVYDEKRSI